MCKSGINEIFSLNSTFKPPRVDLLDNGLLVMGRKLGGTATRIVLLVSIHSLPNLADSTRIYTSFIMDLTIGIALFQERRHRRAFSSRSEPHGGCKGQEDGGIKFNIPN